MVKCLEQNVTDPTKQNVSSNAMLVTYVMAHHTENVCQIKNGRDKTLDVTVIIICILIGITSKQETRLDLLGGEGAEQALNIK
jgi:hypothetical protein